MINIIESTSQPTPKILQVDSSGIPQKWISLKKAVTYYATDEVMFELGNPIKTFRGGYNRLTEAQSKITTNSIISIKGRVLRQEDIVKTPKLTNKSLFKRDRYVCAYCADCLPEKDLSREHINPTWQKGRDEWMNVVTACKYCNNFKGGRNLQQAKMTLLYLPYVPNRNEGFILSRGTSRILADQMEFLLKKVPKNLRSKYTNDM